MRFTILSRYQAEKFNPVEKSILISIYSPGDEAPEIKFKNKYLGILQIAFHDLDQRYPGLERMTKKQAKEILDFVHMYCDTADTIVVHCDAGFSRSPAVTAALAHIFGEEDKYCFAQYRPNMHVYRTILNVYHEDE